MPIFNTMHLKMQNEIICYSQSDNELGLYFESTKLYNAINYILLINEMERLIEEKMFYSLSNISNSNCDQIKNKLLLYIHNKSGVGKSRVIYAIKLKCIFLL